MTPDQQFSLPSSSALLGDGIMLGFLLLALLYVVFSGVFYYHWQEFSSDKRVTGLTYTAYALTTVPTILVLAIVAFTQ